MMTGSTALAAENAALKAEVQRLRAERAQMHADYKTQNDAIVRLQDEVEQLRALLTNWADSFASSIEGGEADELVAATRAALAKEGQ